MKNFKIVFASLLLAVMGVVGFSSFTTVKKVTSTTYVYSDPTPGDESNPAKWDIGTPSGCNGSAVICSLTFDDGRISIDDAVSAAFPNPTQASVSVPVQGEDDEVVFISARAN